MDSNVKCFELGGHYQCDEEAKGDLMVFNVLVFRFNCNKTWYCTENNMLVSMLLCVCSVVSLLVGELVGGDFISWPEPDSLQCGEVAGGRACWRRLRQLAMVRQFVVW